jgi:hypothetical protein
MRLGQDVLSNLEAATAREWLIANGVGGTSSGTAAGAHTRRSHAHLMTADEHGRLAVTLLKLDEVLTVNGERHELGCNFIETAPTAGSEDGAPPQARPAGHMLLAEFHADPWPTWRWRAGGATLEKSLFMVDGHHALAVAYRHLDGPPCRLSVSPLLAARTPETLQLESDGWRGAAQAVPGRVRFEPVPGVATLTLWHSGTFLPARVWLRGIVYPADREPAPARLRSRRAPEAPPSEAAFVPGYLECEIPVGGAFHVVAASESDLFRALAVEGRLGAPPPKTLAECVALIAEGERERAARWSRASAQGADVTARAAAAAHGGAGEALARRAAPLVDAHDPWLARLAPALADGLARRDGRITLLTALPAGGERCAETLRALPALVSLRAFEPAREILRGYLDYLNEGLAPKGFDPENGRPKYGDAAPALWLVHAAELLARRSEDLAFLRDPVQPAVDSIVQAYRAGTRAGIKVGADGLLSAGEGEAACCRADLNALWFHALVAAAQLARLTGRKESGAFHLAWAREHQSRVLESMWDEERGCLFESLGPQGPRRGLSPAQLLAVSLSPPLLPAERAARLVATVERELVTPLGLRASPEATAVSPAWLGPFITAYLRVQQRSPAAQSRAREWLETLRRALDDRSAHHVPELIPAPRRGDAAARRDAGTPSPASVLGAAELLRVWIEDVERVEEPASVA